MRARPSKRKIRGQALVEFALVLPLLILLVFGAVDLGRLFFTYISITNAARVGARYGIIYKTAPILDTSTCPSLDYQDALHYCWIRPDIRSWVIKEAEGSGISLATALANGTATIDVECPVRTEFQVLLVRVNYRFDLVMGFLFPAGIQMSRQVEMRIP